MKFHASAFAAVCASLPAMASASCESAFSTVNTNWTSESAMADSASSFNLCYEYIDQSQVRSGSSIATGQLPCHHDEVGTVNRNLVAGLSHNLSAQTRPSCLA